MENPVYKYFKNMKTIIITGSSRGIGRATAEYLLEHKTIKVIGTSTSGTSSLVHPNFTCLPLNLSSTASIQQFAEQIADIPIDYLINCAAILLEDKDLTKINRSQLEATFQVNLFGTIELTETLLPRIQLGGHIINLTSEWGAFNEPNFDAQHPHYKLSKAAMNMYTKLLAKRLEDLNITVSSFDPGWTQTDMGGAGAPRKPSEVAQELAAMLENDVPSGRFWHKGKERPW